LWLQAALLSFLLVAPSAHVYGQEPVDIIVRGQIAVFNETGDRQSCNDEKAELLEIRTYGNGSEVTFESETVKVLDDCNWIIEGSLRANVDIQILPLSQTYMHYTDDVTVLDNDGVIVKLTPSHPDYRLDTLKLMPPQLAQAKWTTKADTLLQRVRVPLDMNDMALAATAAKYFRASQKVGYSAYVQIKLARALDLMGDYADCAEEYRVFRARELSGSDLKFEQESYFGELNCMNSNALVQQDQWYWEILRAACGRLDSEKLGSQKANVAGFCIDSLDFLASSSGSSNVVAQAILDKPAFRETWTMVLTLADQPTTISAQLHELAIDVQRVKDNVRVTIRDLRNAGS
ncbi:MAG: hypothetical protein JNL25_15950, partial [Rhodospirillaceae bacterium]|nr:hypothetical protein [Rhodospirillaceae bacterium]